MLRDRMNFSELLHFYENHLREQVMPFWLEHCLEREYGGLTNCVRDDGTLISTDKVGWSQGRALWTFSALYNDFDADPRWLDAAECVARFVMEHGRDESGAWPFRLHRNGSVAEGPTSVYVDAFGIYGLAEYARASGCERALQIALETYERTSPLLADHTSLPTEPHPIPRGLQSHGPSMIFALVYHDLGVLTGRRDIQDKALELAEIVMTQHLKPEHKLLYELVRPGGELEDSDAGKTFVPGHVIESMWFMDRIYGHHNRTDRVALAMRAIRWHLEKGWDEQFGGLFLACHAEGGPPVWHRPQAKVWWPHTEALYALLRAHEVTAEPWCMEWYRRVHQYSFDLFPDLEHGEWHQNFNRQGRPAKPVIEKLQIKDPFHLPRALIYSILVLRRLAETEGPTTGEAAE